MIKKITFFLCAFLLAGTALADVTCDPDDVVFAEKGYSVVVVSGNSAVKMALECKCKVQIHQQEKLVIILDLKEMCI